MPMSADELIKLEAAMQQKHGTVDESNERQRQMK